MTTKTPTTMNGRASATPRIARPQPRRRRPRTVLPIPRLWRMWRRLRRRTLAPRRPAMFAQQAPLVVLTVAAVVAGLAVLAWALLAR